MNSATPHAQRPLWLNNFSLLRNEIIGITEYRGPDKSIHVLYRPVNENATARGWLSKKISDFAREFHPEGFTVEAFDVVARRERLRQIDELGYTLEAMLGEFNRQYYKNNELIQAAQAYIETTEKAWPKQWDEKLFKLGTPHDLNFARDYNLSKYFAGRGYRFAFRDRLRHLEKAGAMLLAESERTSGEATEMVKNMYQDASVDYQNTVYDHFVKWLYAGYSPGFVPATAVVE